MASIPPDALIAATPTTFARQETHAHFFKRVSHLNLQERRLTSLAGIEVCENLRFLFAFGNRLRAIPDAIRELPALEILTLDRNDIGELRNLDCSRRLRKLHLSQNRLARVEGLEACESLEELHVARQRRGDDIAPLSFEPASVHALGRSLRWLDVTGCGLQSLRDFAPCARLTRLDAADNALGDLSELLSLMHGSWHCLETLDVRGSPALREQALSGIAPGAAAAAAANAAGPHWDLIVAAGSDSLTSLDGRPVADTTRAFVRAIARRRGIVLPGDFAAMRRAAEAEAAAAQAAAEMEGGGMEGGDGMGAPPPPLPPEAAPLSARGGSDEGLYAPATDAESPPHSSRPTLAPPPPYAAAPSSSSPPPAWASYLAGPRLPPHADPEGQNAPAHRPARTPSDLARGSRFQAAARVDAGLRLRLEKLQMEAAVAGAAPPRRGAGSVDSGSPRGSVASSYGEAEGGPPGGPVAAPTQRRSRHRLMKGRPRSVSPRPPAEQLPPPYGEPGGGAAPSTRSFYSPRFGGADAGGGGSGGGVPGVMRPPSAVWGGPPRFSARLPPLRKTEEAAAAGGGGGRTHEAAEGGTAAGGPATGGRARPNQQPRPSVGAASSSSSSATSLPPGGQGAGGGSARAGGSMAGASGSRLGGRASASNVGPGGGRGTPGGLGRSATASGGVGEGAAPTVVASTLPQPPPASSRATGRQRLPVGAEGPLA